MSTAATATESSPFRPVISHETLRFDYPDADLILRSPDSYEFRVLKTYIVHSSPMLEEKVLIFPNPQPEPTPTTPAVEDSSTNGLCIVELPIEGAILFSLLTYIFPVPPVLPSAVEHVMELLTVAQMYKMDVVLTHIRNHIAQRDPPLIRKETAFFIYSFSMTHNLRPEALQAAECTLSFASLAIDDLFKENVLDTMPIAFLPGFWKYHQRVQSNLSLGLKEFETSNALTVLGESSCESFTGIPLWVKEYISTIEIGRVTAFLDITDFHMALAEHTQTGQADNQGSFRGCASCSNIPRESIREIWRALTAAVRGSISYFLLRKHGLKFQLVKRLLHPSIRICLMRTSSSNHQTLSISVSINRCWLCHRPFSVTCSPSPNLQTVQRPMNFPWFMYPRIRWF